MMEKKMSKLSLPWRVVGGLLLGALTVWIISLAATRLPYSPIRDEITDAASLPALLIAGILYPEGVHTGGGVPRWGIAFLGAGILFYAVVWFGILSWMTRRSRMA